MPNLSWVSNLLNRFEVSNAEALIIIAMVVLVVGLVVRDRRHREALEATATLHREDIAKLDDRNREDIAAINAKHREDVQQLWSDLKEVRGKYYRVDALQSNCALAINFISGSIEGMPEIKLINQSADGDGDHSINRGIRA